MTQSRGDGGFVSFYHPSVSRVGSIDAGYHSGVGVGVFFVFFFFFFFFFSIIFFIIATSPGL